MLLKEEVVCAIDYNIRLFNKVGNRGCNSGCIKIIYLSNRYHEYHNLDSHHCPNGSNISWFITGKNFIDIISKHRSQSLKRTAISNWSFLLNFAFTYPMTNFEFIQL